MSETQIEIRREAFGRLLRCNRKTTNMAYLYDKLRAAVSLRPVENMIQDLDGERVTFGKPFCHSFATLVITL